jgi:drug/metabolite transporter (DMT)-like permease
MSTGKRTDVASGRKLEKTWVVCLLALICCALWGSAFPCIKAGYQLFGIASEDTASVILFAGVRFFLAGILTILIGSIQQRRLLRVGVSSLHKVLILALFQTVLQYIRFYLSLAHTSAVNASILDGTVWFFAILVSALIFRSERFTGRKALGCLLGFAGIVLVSINGTTFQLSFGGGDVLMLLAAFSSSFSHAFLRVFTQSEDPVTLSGHQFLIGGLVMVILGFLFGGRLHPVSPAAFVLLIYMALISAVAYTLWGILLKYNPVSRVCVFGFMTPVFGVLLSALFVGEHGSIGVFTLLALLLVSAGIVVIQMQSRQKNKSGIQE